MHEGIKFQPDNHNLTQRAGDGVGYDEHLAHYGSGFSGLKSPPRDDKQLSSGNHATTMVPFKAADQIPNLAVVVFAEMTPVGWGY